MALTPDLLDHELRDRLPGGDGLRSDDLRVSHAPDWESRHFGAVDSLENLDLHATDRPGVTMDRDALGGAEAPSNLAMEKDDRIFGPWPPRTLFERGLLLLGAASLVAHVCVLLFFAWFSPKSLEADRVTETPVEVVVEKPPEQGSGGPDAGQKAGDAKAAEQKAEQQKAADQKAAEQKAAEAKAAEQKAAEQKTAAAKAADQKAAEEKATEQKAADQAAAEQKAAEEKAAEQKAAEEKAVEQAAAEQKAAEQKAAEEKAEKAEQKAAAQKAAEERAAERAEKKAAAKQEARAKAEAAAEQKQAKVAARAAAKAAAAAAKAESSAQQAAQGGGLDASKTPSTLHLPFDNGPPIFRAVAVPLPTEGGDEVMSYKVIVFGMLERAKQYPETARERGARGTAVVSFTVDDVGELTNVSLLQTSGDTDLDIESVALVARAAPFPKPPEGAQHSFAAEITFGLQAAD